MTGIVASSGPHKQQAIALRSCEFAHLDSRRDYDKKWRIAA